MKEFTEIRGSWPATLFVAVDGTHYAVSGRNWIEVPKDITFEEIRSKWICTGPMSMKPSIPHVMSRKVLASNGKDHYTVTVGSIRNCTCSGFGWRRNCKHVTEVEEDLGIDPPLHEQIEA